MKTRTRPHTNTLIRALGFTALSIAHTSAVTASTAHLPPGPNLSLSDVSHGHGVISGSKNPSAPAYDHLNNHENNMGGSLHIGAGVEYGNVDLIFDLIDQVNNQFNGEDSNTTPGGGSPNNPGTGNPGNLPNNPTFEDIVNNNPEIQEWINQTTDQLATMGSALLLISSEGYAKAFLNTSLPVLVTNDLWGGSLTFTASAEASSTAIGILDAPSFNKDHIIDQFKKARALTSTDPTTTYALTDSINMTVNPNNQDVDIDFQNDSLLLVKSAKISTFSVSYSRQIQSYDHGKLFIGVQPKIFRVGLSQIDTRFGDITNSENLFDDIKDAEFNYDTHASIDFGAIWAGNNYHIGATLSDVFEPEFSFPQVDERKYTKARILNRLKKESTYTIESQFRTEASIFTTDRQWSANAGYDVNPIKDPMGDEYQWASISGAYHTKSWIVPGLRLGYRENLAGSKLQYVSAGISMLRYLNLDIATTLDTVEMNGQELPRSFNVSFGFDVAI